MAGRKGKYDTHVQPRLTSITAWRRRGLIEEEICKNLGVSVSSFAEYKNAHSELLEALKTGKDDADAQVENALFKRAVGYEFIETKSLLTTGKDGQTGSGSGRVEKITKAERPDVTAQIFYLKNRAADRWRDRIGHEVTGAGGGPLQTGVVRIYIPDNERGDGNPDPDSKGERPRPSGDAPASTQPT